MIFAKKFYATILSTSKIKKNTNEKNIRYREDLKLFEARYIAGKKSDGKPIRKSIYDKNKNELKKKLIKIQNEINEGKYLEQSVMPLKDWMKHWLQTYKKNILKKTTYSSYEQHIRVHINPCIGHIKLKDLDTNAIQRFLNDRLENGKQPIVMSKKTGIEYKEREDKKLSIATVKKINNILYQALDKAVDINLIRKNPCKAVELPKLGRWEVKPLSPEEEDVFLSQLRDEKYRMFFIMALDTGLRRGEMLALTWDDIDLETGEIQVNKELVRVYNPDTKKSSIEKQNVKTLSSNRKVFMSEDIIPLLIEHKNKQIETVKKLEEKGLKNIYSDNNLVFCSDLGKPLEGRNILRSLYRICEKAGIKRTNIHNLRHTYATALVSAGVNLRIICKLLGHANIGITNTYTHPDDQTLRDGANKRKLHI